MKKIVLISQKRIFLTKLRVCVNMLKYITLQVSLSWFKLFILLCSHRVVITL